MSPNAPGTQHRSVRISDEDWADLETRAAEQGLDRAKVINHLIKWYLRRPKVTQPVRPPVPHGPDSPDGPDHASS